MSFEASAAVWKHSQHQGSHLLVMLALANISDESGFSWPKIDYLARMTRLSERMVKYALADLEKSGELAIKRGTGRGNSSEYVITIEGLKGANSAPFTDDKGCNPRQRKGAIRDRERVQSATLLEGTPLKTLNTDTSVNTSLSVVSLSPISNRLTPAEKALPDAARAELSDRRWALFTAYCRGVGIAEGSAAFQVAMNFVTGDLTPEIVTALTPDKLEEMARWVAEQWAADNFPTPKIPKVIEREPDFDRWVAAGRPGHATRVRQGGRRQTENDLLDAVIEGRQHG